MIFQYVHTCPLLKPLFPVLGHPVIYLHGIFAIYVYVYKATVRRVNWAVFYSLQFNKKSAGRYILLNITYIYLGNDNNSPFYDFYCTYILTARTCE